MTYLIQIVEALLQTPQTADTGLQHAARTSVFLGRAEHGTESEQVQMLLTVNVRCTFVSLFLNALNLPL